MKTSWIFYALFCLLVDCNDAASAIKNGYAPGIEGARTSLSALQSMYSKDNLSRVQHERLKAQIKQLTEFIYFFEFTESRIAEFRQIAPALVDSINVITDARGRTVDVYVQFVAAEQLPYGVYGTTSILQGQDIDSNISEFGEQTVSVKIRKDAGELRKLAHELGHVAHQVPHLASYIKYYTNEYHNSEASRALGHDAGDLSGISATRFEREFGGQLMTARRSR